MLLCTCLLTSCLEEDHQPKPTQSYFNGNGSSITWDGRVFSDAEGPGWQQAGGCNANSAETHWALRVFRPELVKKDTAGRPVFSPDVYSAPFPWAFSNKQDPATTHMHPCDFLNALSIVPNPRAKGPNPYPTAGAGGGATGNTFETYDVWVFTQDYGTGGSLNTIGVRPGTIVVGDPNTDTAHIASATLDAFTPLGTWPSGGLTGIEPTVTTDGRFMVWQGRTASSDAGKNDFGSLMYSINLDPTRTDVWTPANPIAELYSHRNDSLGTSTVGQLVPLARQPLHFPDGALIDPSRQRVQGAYPWISGDGKDLSFTAAKQSPDLDTSRRSGLSVVGADSNYTIQYIDGSLNPNLRLNNNDNAPNLRLFHGGVLEAPGGNFSAMPNVALPYTQQRPAYGIFGSNNGNYGEVSFEDSQDGNYALFMHMNEMLYPPADPNSPPAPTGSWPPAPGALDFDTARTPDTSGHFNTGVLQPGASFPWDHDASAGDIARNAEVGFLGQGIYFKDNNQSAVTVKETPSLVPGGAITVQLMFKRLVDFDKRTGNNYRALIAKPGSYDLVVGNDGRVQATVYPDGTVEHARRSGVVGPANLPINTWEQVAFTYVAATGTLTTYIDGTQVGQTSFGPGPINENPGRPVDIGPKNYNIDPTATHNPNEDILMIDEVAISNIARSLADIKRAAFLPPQ